MEGGMSEAGDRLEFTLIAAMMLAVVVGWLAG